MLKKNKSLWLWVLGSVVLIVLCIVMILLFTPINNKFIENISSNTLQNTNLDNVTTQITFPAAKGKQPTFIGNFNTQLEKNNLMLVFSFYDDDAETYMKTSGTAKIRIVSDDNTIVYEGNKHISEDNFGTYVRILTKQKFDAIDIQIKISDINKSSIESGTIYLEFTIDGGKTFRELNAKTWDLPVYSS